MDSPLRISPTCGACKHCGATNPQQLSAGLACPQAKLDYAPIRQDYEDFYTRRMYYRLHVSIKQLHYAPASVCCGWYACTRFLWPMRWHHLRLGHAGLLQSAHMQCPRRSHGRSAQDARDGPEVSVQACHLISIA